MDRKTRNYISKFLIVAFLFFLLPSDNYFSAVNEKDGLKKIKEAEKLFIKYKYRNAINKYLEAEKIVKSGKNLSRLYIGLSKSYYALGLEAKSREVIRKIADLTIQSKVDEDKLPRGYLKIYKEILAQIKKDKEESKIVRTEEKVTELKPETFAKETEKPKKQVIERPGKKKIKKKSSILPIVGGALALGAVAFLLTGKKDPGGDTASNTASIHIESTPTGADVYVDGASKGVTTPCDITVSEGSRSIKLVIDGWGETTNTQTFTKDQSYNLNAELSPYKYDKSDNFFINPTLGTYGNIFPNISLDNDNNIYCLGIPLNTSEVHLLKFNSSGDQLSYAILSRLNYLNLRLKISDQFVYNWPYYGYLIASVDVFKHNLDGSYVSNFLKSIICLGGLDVDRNTGYMYVLVRGRKVNYYNQGGSLLGSFPINETDLQNKIFISDNSNYFYMGGSKVGGNRISQYTLSGDLIKSWNSEQGEAFVPHLLTGYGSGETEKIFIISYNSVRISLNVYNSEGVFLTSKSYDSWNIYFEYQSLTIDTEGVVYWQIDRNISKFSVSNLTEGSGTWTVASKQNKFNTKGSMNGFNNSLKLQKRVDRNAVKKELKDKKEGKRIR